MPSRQGGLTVVAEIKPEEKSSLLGLLHWIDTDIDENDLFPFQALSTVHFARWIVLDDRRGRWRGPLDQPERPLLLILSTNFDGSLRDHLLELVEIAGPGLNRVLSHCVGFPAPRLQTKEALLRFMWSRSVRSEAFYSGTPGRTVQQIKHEEELRESIESFLDDTRDSLEELDPLAVRQAIQDHVAKEFPDDRPPRRTRFRTAKKALHWLRLILSGLISLPLLVGLLVFLRRYEKQDDHRRSARGLASMSPSQIRSHNEWVASLAGLEDEVSQNQLTHLVPLRPGWYRKVVARFVLFAVNSLARTVYDRGQLGGIPTIHFARWVIVGDGRWLLFLSNYDGSWEEYLGAFIDRASLGLTAIWSNTVGFPHTRWLAWAGSRDERAFKRWARGQQIPTQAWYNAYPGLTVRQVNNNTAIHAGLYGRLTQREARMWLRRI